MTNSKVQSTIAKIALILFGVVVAMPFTKMKLSTSAFMVSRMTAKTTVENTYWLPESAPIFSLEEDAGQVKVAWQPVEGASGYKVYRDLSTDFTNPTIVYTGADVSVVDTNLSNGTSYYYKLTAVSEHGEISPMTVEAKLAQPHEIVIDDDAQDADFNTSGTTAQSGIGGWSKNALSEALQSAVGGDAYSTTGMSAGQTFTWKTTAQLTGKYDVFAKFQCNNAHGTAQYDIFADATQMDSTRTSQACAAAQTTSTWVKLGSHDFAGQNGSVMLTAPMGEFPVVADAVAFQRVGDVTAVLPLAPSPAPAVEATASAEASESAATPSATPTPTPSATPNATPSPTPTPVATVSATVTINEIMPSENWIELTNTTDKEIDVKNWTLTDEQGNVLKIAQGNSDNNLHHADGGETTIPAQGYLAVYRPSDAKFALPSAGEHTITLANAEATTIDSIKYADLKDHESMARFADEANPVAGPVPTLGRANAKTQADLQPMIQLWSDDAASASAQLNVIDAINYTKAHYLVEYMYGDAAAPQQDGVMGDLEITDQWVTKKGLYFGTCSTNGTCIPAQSVLPESIKVTVTLTGEGGIPDRTITQQLSGGWK